MAMLNFSFYDWRRQAARIKQAGRGGIGRVFRDKRIRALVIRNRGVIPGWSITESPVKKPVFQKEDNCGTCRSEMIAQIDAIVVKYGANAEYLPEMLFDIQKKFRYTGRTAIDRLGILLRIPKAYIHHAVTVDPNLTSMQTGENTISVCMGSACLGKGSAQILTKFEEELGIKAGDTTTDGKFTLISAPCLGVCSKAPAVRINDEIISISNAATVKKVVDQYRDGGVK
jgi:NADH-quinone oxidoreductase subunit E